MILDALAALGIAWAAFLLLACLWLLAIEVAGWHRGRSRVVRDPHRWERWTGLDDQMLEVHQLPEGQPWAW